LADDSFMTLQRVSRLTRRPARSGQIAVLTALSIVFFLALSGLAIDLGELWNTRRQMQTAADAAAIAAVNDLAVQNSTDVTTDAKNATAKNGFTDGGATSFSASLVNVTVQTPPTSGAFKSNTGAVTVTIAQGQPTQFLQFVGFKTIPVSVSATGLTQSAGSCIYSLDPSGSGALTIAGNASLTSACGVYVDSSSSSAAIASGNAAISAPMLGVVGGTTINGGASVPVTTSIPAFGDPLAYLGVPSVGSCASYSGKTDNGNKTENPGLFCGGLTIASSANVTLNPGLYVLNGGGLTIKGAVTGNGVTFYLTGTAGGAGKYTGVTIASGSSATLKAPNTCNGGAAGGSMNGVLMFQDRSIVGTSPNQSTINGSATSSFDGALYFPTTTLNYSGTSASSGYTYLVAYDLKVSGSSSIGNNYSCLNGTSSIIQNAALVM
jgi:Flp pilus assembly protein TadG